MLLLLDLQYRATATMMLHHNEAPAILLKQLVCGLSNNPAAKSRLVTLMGSTLSLNMQVIAFEPFLQCLHQETREF